MTERLGRTVLCLPLFGALRAADVDGVAAEVAAFMGAVPAEAL